MLYFYVDYSVIFFHFILLNINVFLLLICIGSKTWDRFEMRIHKRVIELLTTIDTVKDIINVTINSGVDVDIALIKSKK